MKKVEVRNPAEVDLTPTNIIKEPIISDRSSCNPLVYIYISCL